MKERFFISKYALSGGIREDEFEVSHDGEYASERFQMFKIGRDAHRDRAGAMAAAEAMRMAKIASLKKQLAKLEKISFGDAPIPYTITDKGREMLKGRE